MNELVHILVSNFKLPEPAAVGLSSIVTSSTLKKGETFVKVEQSNQSEYLVAEGICQSFITNLSGKEVTLSFFTEGSAVSPNLIRTINNKSIVNLRALTEVQLLTFKSIDLANLMNTSRAVEVWANGVLQSELLQKVKKEINQNSLSAKERLLEFRAQYPALENKIPHIYIASYLGISNVSLSRLRKRLSTF